MALDTQDPTLARLDDQLDWYDRKSAFSKRWYIRLRLAALVSAAAVPITSTFGHSAVTSVLGVVIVIVEGVQQLNDFHENWMRYRSTAESLKHEKYLHAALAGPYHASDDPKRLLAERVEELVSTEHSRWVSDSSRTQQAKADAQRDASGA
jgi:hypothetical protein